MAAWRATLADNSIDMCSCCFADTKYVCIDCCMPICNKCSTFENDEDTDGWRAGRSVGHCEPCFKTKKPQTKNSDGGKQKQANNGRDRTNNPESTFEEPHSPSDSEEEPLDIDKQKDGLQENEEDGSKLKKKPKKAGRKSRWSQELLSDFVDIIVSSDHYKTKLIFRNTKFQQNGEIYGKIREELKQRCAARGESFCFTVEQLRSKFKKCVSECKRAALTIKTGTGIKRFQEDKNLGAWFNKLYDIVKTRDSCQPEQAREPSATQSSRSATSTPTVDTSESEMSSVDQNMFVPVKQPKRKSNRDDPICEAIKLMKTIAEKDPSKELITFMKDDIEKAREHELKLMQMMLSYGNQQPFQGQSPSFAAGHVGFASPACNSDSFYMSYPPAPHQSIQSAYVPEGSMYQGPSNYQFRPLSPANSRSASVNSNSTRSPASVGEASTLIRANSPVYHSM